MKKIVEKWLSFLLVVGAFASCTQDNNEPNSEVSRATATVSLHAEVSVDDSDLRAISYKLGTNANGKLVPMPQFKDNQLVDVHTIIKSNRSNDVGVVQTLKWRYDAESKKLVLTPKVKSDGVEYINELIVNDFNDDSGAKWYISGMLGGTLDPLTKKVSFKGTPELRGADGNQGDILGDLNVPYAFGWTELNIDTNSNKVGTSYSFAEISEGSEVKFLPMGSLIAYKLGTDQIEGAYAFTPKGFTVSSNSFSDQGTFSLNTRIPIVGNAQSVLPEWTESAEYFNRNYTFSNDDAPGVIEHQQIASKTYYCWVMPHTRQPEIVRTRVMLKGKSSRTEVDAIKDTGIWFTDYKIKDQPTKLRQGYIHGLTAKATHPVFLPIHYVTDYNLAGGEGLTYTVTKRNPQPVGARGPLRFANIGADGQPLLDGHSADASGYYNGFKVNGILDNTYNPDNRNLQDEVDKTFGVGKYVIPTIEQYWGVWPARRPNWFYESEAFSPRESEFVGVGTAPNLYRFVSYADYRAGDSFFTNQPSVTYALRFQKYPNASMYNPTTITLGDNWDWNGTTNSYNKHNYEPLFDNSLKCAYRYKRLKTNGLLIVDVVYLGEEPIPTSIDDISKEQWWKDRKDEIISRSFPSNGYIQNVSNSVSGSLTSVGTHGYYWGSPRATNLDGWIVQIHYDAITSSSSHHLKAGNLVRLFHAELK